MFFGEWVLVLVGSYITVELLYAFARFYDRVVMYFRFR